MDAFAAKINPFLSGPASLVYSTYLGGMNREEGGGIAVDAEGNAWIAGTTASNAVSFPLIGAVQTELGGKLDAFIMKLNASGTDLLFSTFLGGAADDRALNLAVDAKGDTYVTGMTDGTFPTRNALQPDNAGGNDIFIAKLSSAVPVAAPASWTQKPRTVDAGGSSKNTTP